MYQILTDLATLHTSQVLRQYKHSNGIMSDYYIPETVTATVTIGRGNSIKCRMGYETSSFLWSLLNLYHLKCRNSLYDWWFANVNFCSSYFTSQNVGKHFLNMYIHLSSCSPVYRSPDHHLWSLPLFHSLFAVMTVASDFSTTRDNDAHSHYLHILHLSDCQSCFTLWLS